MTAAVLPARGNLIELRPIPFGRPRYRAVLADPPWRFATRSAKGEGRSAQRHYTCMAFADLARFADDIALGAVCAADCAMLMWTTAPMMASGQAHAVMRAWGFAPRTMSGWLKLSRAGKPVQGTGQILRSEIEPYLIGTRGGGFGTHGERGAIVTETGWDETGFEAIRAQRQGHSIKPDEAHAIVERRFRGPYLELFARRRHAGWDAYGDALGGFVAAEELGAEEI